ncbi:hypothetical protein Avbf_02365 [Armadillidium vulgare]|nr:hypothetical protein Avbf_02365 [Armadillidium vulgare]
MKIEVSIQDLKKKLESLMAAFRTHMRKNMKFLEKQLCEQSMVETINNENQLNKIENRGCVDNRLFRTVF